MQVGTDYSINPLYNDQQESLWLFDNLRGNESCIVMLGSSSLDLIIPLFLFKITVKGE